jgi:sporulation integral membrane protein YlbJ
MAMSVTSGYPMGPKLISQLRQQKSITRIEGERMLSFCTTSGPLFMLGAVAVGMYGSTALGITLLAAHYLACLSTGLMFRFYKRDRDLYFNKSSYNRKQKKDKILKSAFNSLYNARITDGRPLGKLLGDAVKDSVYTLLQIGGFIILFSVIISILDITGILDTTAGLIHTLLPGSLDTGLIKALVSGVFEITVGSKLGSEVPGLLLHKTWIVCSIITWGGLSVHAQVASLLSNCDISIKPYITAKSIQAVLAGIYGFILFRITFPLAQAAFKPSDVPREIGWLGSLVASGKLMAGLLGVLATVAVLCLLIRNLKIIKL